MLNRFSFVLLTLIAASHVFGQQAEASNLMDIYYDFDVYYGVEEPVYDLYVEYKDGSEELYHTYTSTSQLSNQMFAFAEGKRPASVVDWYYVKDRRVLNWYRYSRYATQAQAASNADWLEEMGFEVDIRLVYNPTFRR